MSAAAPTVNDEVVFVSFNQDSTSLAVGTHSGYKLFSIDSSDTLTCIYENAQDEVLIAERLFNSYLMALVTASAPRKLRITHFKKATEICNYSYSSKILAVKMNRTRLVVCLDESLFVHNIRDMKVLHTIRDTPPNQNGLCALSTNANHSYLAYPGHSSVGELQIFDAMNLSSTRTIQAHSSPLAAISFSPSGLRVATASEKGTVIRVFNVVNGNRLYELRRGLKRTVDIHSLSFSPCEQFLACSSNTETIHVFRLEEKPRESIAVSPSPPEDKTVQTSSSSNESWMNFYFNSVMSLSAPYLPSQVTDTLLQGRAFATVHHNQQGMKNICALAMIRKTLRLLLASSDGMLYLYAVPLNEGGDCTLMKQFKIAQDSAVENQLENEHKNDDEGDVSYADLVRNRHPGEMTDSEKFHEMDAATASPPRECFLLDDDGEFPPMTKVQ